MVNSIIIQKIRDKYATSARAIALHLKDYCDTSLPYDEMIAEAARRAGDAIVKANRRADAAIKEMKLIVDAVRDEVVSKGVSFKRIIELMEADMEGRAVVLPCKVGDTVYWATTADEIPCIFKGAIYNFSVDNTEGRLWVYVKHHNGLNYHHPVDEDFGKTLFLTRAEAEESLKGDIK